MIYGRKQKHLESNKEYDYIACLYPEGKRINVFFSIMRILQKLFIGGFTDEEGEVFTNKYLTAGVRQ